MSDATIEPSLHSDEPEGIDPGRTLALTDAVVAIAMTLLALDLKPTLERTASTHRLAVYLGHHLGQYAAFAIAFALIAQYWMAHHQLMRGVRRASPRLMAETLVFLFAITLMPLSTYLTGTYSNPLANSIFAGNIFLVSLTLGLTGETVHRERLDGGTEQWSDRTARRVRSIVTLTIPTVVGVLDWVWGGHAAYLYLLFFALDYPGRLATRRRVRAS
ncbi:TMEM175 family protein [Jatrophihabitans endophyticus]|uniref:TMEM175 family protein n=1 Tax=Jatrophihabitans endophyticus TaxID=1206085 RepID=UPI001A0542B6|nr:TMEM175 family protein [Jatrophihabitans endophyticus]MBE7188912.1 DUF1211 domain-containing protein [Jatrophihabitans endophyticus]